MAAIAARVINTAEADAVSKITLTNMMDKNGSKVAFSAWFDKEVGTSENPKTETRSWTSFIPKTDTALTVNENGAIMNAVNEVWLNTTDTVTYNLDGGTNATANLSVYTTEMETITLGSPTKTGYTFAGWYDAVTGGTKVMEITKGSTGDHILYARFTQNEGTTEDVTVSPGGNTPQTGGSTPQTGDGYPIIPLCLLLGLTSLGAVLMLTKKKKYVVEK